MEGKRSKEDGEGEGRREGRRGERTNKKNKEINRAIHQSVINHGWESRVDHSNETSSDKTIKPNLTTNFSIPAQAIAEKTKDQE
jgi:hypothetical protein